MATIYDLYDIQCLLLVLVQQFGLFRTERFRGFMQTLSREVLFILKPFAVKLLVVMRIRVGVMIPELLFDVNVTESP